ncbi:MAG: S-layer homology domain-containing protein [Clostridia bacterium]|nr:S-layer homology domain-containing protein [Clostridia bacterium]
MKKILVVLSVSLMLFVSTISAGAFSDIAESDYCHAAATFLQEKGVLTGYPDGSFGANDNVTRAQMAAIVCRIADTPNKTNSKVNFSDVSDGHWAKDYVSLASNLGIINGDGDGRFRPEDNVKYEEAIKMVVCAVGLADNITPDPLDWSKPYLSIADKYSITDNLLGKKGNPSTRADIAVMTYASLNPVEKEPLRLIAHRGFSTEAPENTESSFRLAKEKGFKYVETDVKFTKDGVAVLLHDASVDRTSDGTGNIADLTLAEVKTLDFGSWKSEAFAGEKILTFEEFIVLCKELNIHPYIEMNGNCWNEKRISGLISTIKKYGMEKNVTFLSQKTLMLGWVAGLDSDMRLCYCISTPVTQEIIDTVNGWKTKTNVVVLDADKRTITEEGISLCKANGIPLGVWTVNDISYINSMPNYISEVTTDTILPETIS